MTEPEQHEPAAAELTSGDMPAADSGEAETTEVTHAAPDADEQNNGAHTSAEGDNGEQNGGENGGDEEAEIVESVGGADAMEEVPDRAPRYRRQYKIQEVIKRRQVMLVQVVKEERGTKGAALTTYLSLAGRYSVLMPNTARGGGISRKITNSEDRARLKEAAADLEVPEGMGVILRTAGASRTKIEIKRDFEYLLRLWETVRDLTLKSTAPKLVYEEGSLVKRSIRDLYGKDIDEVIVAGSEAYHEAKDFMRMLMPSHAKSVKPYTDTQPLLSRYGVESQLDAMFSPVVQLRSGGYIVLNQAEALVAIDVNSGRATREHHIEDTALKTNLEASEIRIIVSSMTGAVYGLPGTAFLDFFPRDWAKSSAGARWNPGAPGGRAGRRRRGAAARARRRDGRDRELASSQRSCRLARRGGRCRLCGERARPAGCSRAIRSSGARACSGRRCHATVRRTGWGRAGVAGAAGGQGRLRLVAVAAPPAYELGAAGDDARGEHRPAGRAGLGALLVPLAVGLALDELGAPGRQARREHRGSGLGDVDVLAAWCRPSGPVTVRITAQRPAVAAVSRDGDARRGDVAGYPQPLVAVDRGRSRSWRRG